MAAAALFRPESIVPNTRLKKAARLERRIGQILLASIIALCVTISLFIMMERLVRIDMTAPTKIVGLPNLKLTPSEPDIKLPEPRPPVARISTPPPPAMRPVSWPSLDGASIPATVFSAPVPEAPAKLSDIRIDMFSYSGPMEAIPVRAPRATYPRRALQLGLSGSCDVSFSITAAGEPYNMSAACTNAIFEDAALRAVAKAQFSPAKTADGKPRPATNLVFPIEFQFSE